MKKFFSLFAAVLFAGSMMADNFELVSSANALANGDEIIITNVDATAAISTTQNSNNRGVADVTLTDGVIVPGASVQIITLVADETNFMLQVGNDAYLYAASNSSNHLKTATASTAGNNGKFAITFDAQGVATVVAQGNNARNNLRYNPNNGSPMFSCYAATSSVAAGLKIYKKASGSVPPSEPVVEYYLVGSMNNWSPADGYKLAANAASAGEYMLKTTFAANDQFKVRKVVDGEADTWYPDGMDNNYTVTAAGKYNVYFRPDGQGGEGWHYGFIYAAPIVPKTCAEVYNMAKNDEVLMNDLTVTYVNGKNVYVKDASGAMLLYLPEDAEWAAGDVLSGVEGTVDIYKNLYEVKPSAAQVAAVTATSGTAPEPIEFTAAPVAADMNKYIVMNNVSVAAGEFTTESATNLDLTIGDATVILRNSFKIAQTFVADKTYNVVGVCAVYNDNVQVYFISAEEVVDPRMAGAYNVGGEGADYATLSAAAADLRAKGLKGDVTLLICADIAEVANVGLVNETDYTITIAPNAAAKRTISFGDVADNVGPSGHIMIGYDMAAWASTATKNIVIDGSYEGEGQYLELQAGTVGGVVVVFYGKASNSVVKNCRLINHRTTKTNYVAQFRTEQGAGSAKTNFGPSNVGFENCYMEVNKVANTQAIYYNGSTAATDAGLPKDCYVRGCEIVSNLRGIFFNGAMNAVIEGNTFRMASASGGFLAHGIMGNVQKGAIVVRGNKFIELGTMNTSPNEYGICGITASGGADVWVIENNYFAGLDSKADVSGKIVTLRYVRCGDSCVVRHNSFYLPAQTYHPATDLVASQAVTCLWLAGAKAYPVENNIFVSAETVAKNSLIRGALNENVKNNVFYHNGGEAAILAGAVVAADSAAFFALEGTAGSKWKLPVFANAAIGDLAITTADADLQMPRMADVLVDIMGSERRENTYAGAFEGPEPGQGTSLDMTEVEGVEKIFRNGQVLIIKNGKTYNMMGQVVE